MRPLQDTLEMCTKEMEFKCILFALCYFHAVVAERRKFGAQGWNRSYPFNNGDLTISINVLYNYLEANAKVRGGPAVQHDSPPASLPPSLFSCSLSSVYDTFLHVITFHGGR